MLNQYMIKTLRPYQQDALNNLKKRLKATTHPLLLNISVGGGKSLIIAELLLWLEQAGFRALCLTLNSTLIKQNADAYNLQNGHGGIHCAGLKSKAYKELVIFGSPHSVCQGIRKKDHISRQPFNLIVVDEAHNISPHDNASMYMRIVNHYGMMAQESQYSFRIVGLTGTPYRGKNVYIVGEDQLFKEEVATITAPWLIEQGYLTKPQFGLTTKSIDFSGCKDDWFGNFKQKDLEIAIHKDERLTGEIMRELQTIPSNGIFIFASTRKHCEECARSLPEGQWAIITGDTPHDERQRILERARQGTTRYLINVNVLTVGVDVPSFDVCAWLRPTESLILYTQGIGRVLRLHPGKESALVLDYAGNIERHGDIDDPIINQALQPKASDDPEYCIPCYTCNTNNTIHARRCIGIVDDRRCDHYFQFKECPHCQIQNDTTSRYCRGCEGELIDPNEKLIYESSENPLVSFRIKKCYHQHGQSSQGYPTWKTTYITHEKINIEEYYILKSMKHYNIFYGQFLKQNVIKGAEAYWRKEDMTGNPECYFFMNTLKRINSYRYRFIDPETIQCQLKNNKYFIKKKIFREHELLIAHE